MKLTNTAIKFHTTVVVLTVILVIGGLYSYTTIPKEAQPSIEIPNIIVTTVYPGASPSDIESLVTQHIELELQNINGIKEIRSTSTEGVSSIIVEFEPDVAIDEAFSKVRDKVDVAKTKLPSDVEEPAVAEIDFSEFPILTVNLSAPFPLTRLKKVAEELESELESISSVLGVDVVGGLDREVQINADLSALQGYNLSFADLLNTIRDENTNIPGGSVDVDDLNYLVRIDGEFQDPAEIENLVISSKNGVPIFVRDVADVDFGFKDRESYARLAIFKTENADGTLTRHVGEEAALLSVISLNVKKRSGENILETVDQINAVIEAFQFPSGMQVVTTGDESVFVKTLIKDLENNIIGGLIFVISVLLFFLGLRNAALVGIAVPISMLLSFTVFQALGYTLNFIILFSMIIALGMLVDNAIVIVENIFRYREEGHSRFESARLGTGEVAGAVIASTATTVAVFIPMLFWPGLIGEFMGYMPLTLIITLLCSLFVALIINPVLTGMFIRLETESKSEYPPIVKRLFMGVVALGALVLGLSNWKMLVSLGVGIPGIILLHRNFLKPIADRFARKTLPRVVNGYRDMLDTMLKRDYSAPHAMLRNTFALGNFTLGFVLLIGGAVLMSIATPAAAMLLYVPGGILLGIGLLAIALHSIEVVFLGGKRSVRAGIIFAVGSLILLGLMSLGSADVQMSTILDLMVLPIAVMVIGFAGSLGTPKTRLILTDNRSRLLNSSLGGLFAIIVMYLLAPTGVEFFPETDPTQVRVSVAGPLGTNIDASNRLVSVAQERIAHLLSDHKESQENLKNLLVNVGVSENTGMGGGGNGSPERSRITMNIVDYKDREEPSMATLSRIRDELQGIPGAEIKVDKDTRGPPTGAPVNIEISGEDFSIIRSITREIKQRLTRASDTGEIPGLVDISDNLDEGRPELKVKIDRVRAAQFDLNTRKIANTVRSAINGVEAGKYREGDEEYDIIVRLRPSDRATLESLNNLTILEEGVQIPLVSVAELEISSGLGSITRLDQKRVATVSGLASPGYNGQEILKGVQEMLNDYVTSLPPGYLIAYTGENEEQQESFGFLSIAFLIGVSLIFMIMVAQFNRVISPFIIMVAVGLSLIGVILGLVLTRTPFGLMTFIGVISLAGIVVNNNIVLIDYTMQLQARGKSKHDAIIEAGTTRFRPVVLTALTTIIGLIPLTFGINIDFVDLLVDLNPNFQFGSENTQFWGPMGSAIISGLGFATFLTLVIVPVMYSSFDSLASRLENVFRPESGSARNENPRGVAHADSMTSPSVKPPVPGDSGNGTISEIDQVSKSGV